MIIVWIIGALLFVVGGILIAPLSIKVYRCKSHTYGRITDVETANGRKSKEKYRVTYEYMVDGISYTARSSWTKYKLFTENQRCEVAYDEKIPKLSYADISGQAMIWSKAMYAFGAGLIILSIAFEIQQAIK